MNQPDETEIPLLTDIVHPGDTAMFRQFDSQALADVKREGISTEQLESTINELLDEMLPVFRQQLIERLLEKIKT
jgi:hypothetical protein